MSGKPIDPRYSAAFQRHPEAMGPPSARVFLPAVTHVATTEPAGGPTTGGHDARAESEHAERESVGHRRLLWTVALFLVGAGLCAASFALYSEFNFLRWSNATPIAGTDQWVISDGTGYGTRTVDQFHVVFPQYMSQMSIWVGAIGIATIVMNLFRLAAGSSKS